MESIISYFLKVLNLLNTFFLELLNPIIIGEDMLFQLLLEIWELDQDLLVVVLVQHG